MDLLLVLAVVVYLGLVAFVWWCAETGRDLLGRSLRPSPQPAVARRSLPGGRLHRR
jgi:hypothetical protein